MTNNLQRKIKLQSPGQVPQKNMCLGENRKIKKKIKNAANNIENNKK